MNYDVVTLVMHDDAQLHVISTKSFSICNITVVTLTYVCIYVSKSLFLLRVCTRLLMNICNIVGASNVCKLSNS